MLEKFFYLAIKFCVIGLCFTAFVAVAQKIGASSIYDGGKDALLMLDAMVCFFPAAWFLISD